MNQWVNTRCNTNEAQKETIGFFVEPTEKLIYTLGNEYFEDYLSCGSIMDGFAVLSDKRVYFMGGCFSSAGKKYAYAAESRFADIKDITGAQYKRIMLLSKSIWNIILISVIWCIIFILFTYVPDNFYIASSESYKIFQFLFAVSALILSVIIFSANSVYAFEIEFTGGKIAFDLAWYKKKEIDEFKRLVLLLKDMPNDDTAKTIV